MAASVTNIYLFTFGKTVFIYKHFHNILRLFDVLSNFRFSTSKTMCDYYLQTLYIRVASQVAERLSRSEIRKLGNISKVSKLYEIRKYQQMVYKLHSMIPQCAVPLPK